MARAHVRSLAAGLRAQRPAARRAAGPHALGGEHAVDGEVGADDEGHDPPGSGSGPGRRAASSAAPQRLTCTYPLPSEILTLVSSAAEKPLHALQDAVGLGARGQGGDAGPAAHHRDELRVDAVLRDLGAHEHRLGGLAAEAAEHEVAEAVEDEAAVVGLDAVEQVRVVREDDVRAGVDGRLALALLEIARGALVLEVPVPADDDVVGLLLGRLDRRLDGADVGAARRRARARRRRRIAHRQHVREAEEGDLGAVVRLEHGAVHGLP